MNLKEQIEFALEQVLFEVKHDFKWDEFKKIDMPRTMVSYLAKAGVPLLGEGSSRRAYLLSSRFVLKVAVPHDMLKGKAQNEAEVEIFTDPKTRPIVSKIYDFAEDYSWVVAELVRPLRSEKEFKKLTGIDFDDFDLIIYRFESNDFSVEKTIESLEEELEIAKQSAHPRKVRQLEKALKLAEKNSLVNATLHIMDEADLLPADILRANHWGKTSDGRVVILDYGYTDEVAFSHYA